MERQKIVSTTLPESLCKKLDLLAAESYRTRAGYLRHLIKLYLHNIKEHPEQKLK